MSYISHTRNVYYCSMPYLNAIFVELIGLGKIFLIVNQYIKILFEGGAVSSSARCARGSKPLPTPKRV